MSEERGFVVLLQLKLHVNDVAGLQNTEGLLFVGELDVVVREDQAVLVTSQILRVSEAEVLER